MTTIDKINELSTMLKDIRSNDVKTKNLIPNIETQIECKLPRWWGENKSALQQLHSITAMLNKYILTGTLE